MEKTKRKLFAFSTLLHRYTWSMSNQIETLIELQRENRDRFSVFFRWFMAIPVVLLLSLFAQAAHWGITSTIIMAPVVLSLLFREIYPSWVLTFNHAILEFSMRISAYLLFLTDRYPTIEANPSVAVILPDVEGGKKLNRWLPLIKWFLAIPLYIVGIFYILYSFIATVFLWLKISITGESSDWALEVNLDLLKFWNRVFGYAVLLVTDEYPTFALKSR